MRKTCFRDTYRLIELYLKGAGKRGNIIDGTFLLKAPCLPRATPLETRHFVAGGAGGINIIEGTSVAPVTRVQSLLNNFPFVFK